jgi:hypothetical protein
MPTVKERSGEGAVVSDHHVLDGDSAIILGHVEDDSIDGVVTDPPHALGGEHINAELTETEDGRPAITVTFDEAANGFMGASWDRGIGAFGVWREVYRVLKPGGHVFVMSSDRTGGVAGFYLLLKAAGFIIDETQLMQWVSCTGMPKSTDVAQTWDKRHFRAWLKHVGREAVTCPDHKEPKDPETGEKQRCVECERIFREGGLTRHDERKAASAAVNGALAGMKMSAGRMIPRKHSGEGFGFAGGENMNGDDPLLSRLLASYPSAPAEQREVWEAVVDEVPEEWDCSRPPGVRVKTGEEAGHRLLNSGEGGYHGHAKESYRENGREATTLNITAPSTPIACETDGWRGSVSPWKPFAYPILHAMKPFSGTYADAAAANGGGVLCIDAGRIPFEDAPHPRQQHRYESGAGGWMTSSREDVTSDRGEGCYAANPAGRAPANLLSHAGLLGELQKYCDLDAWCEKLGLPDAAADLLEAGAVYAPKSSRAEKSAGLPENFDGKRNPCSKPVALCAYLVTLCTREGDTVLDPFCGEAPVGVACARLGRRFIGVELDAGFAAIARARIAHAAVEDREPDQPQLSL